MEAGEWWIFERDSNDVGRRVGRENMGIEELKDESTGWQRPIGRLKLQVIFRKRATKFRALLRKMTYKDKALYGFWSPCIHGWTC